MNDDPQTTGEALKIQKVLKRVAGPAALAALALALAAPSALAAVRTFDVQGQEVDYGCDVSHPDGQGWVCWEAPPGASQLPADLQPDVAATAASARHGAPARARARARARKASTYNWSYSASGWYGIGSTRIGQLQTSAGISFNGRQGRINSTVQYLWGPPVRIDFRADAYHEPDLVHADGTQAIAPTAPSFTTGTVSMPTWYPYFHGSEYFISWNWYIRASGVTNPSSVDGTFHAGPVHSPVFYCVDSVGSCYFP